MRRLPGAACCRKPAVPLATESISLRSARKPIAPPTCQNRRQRAGCQPEARAQLLQLLCTAGLAHRTEQLMQQRQALGNGALGRVQACGGAIQAGWAACSGRHRQALAPSGRRQARVIPAPYFGPVSTELPGKSGLATRTCLPTHHPRQEAPRRRLRARSPPAPAPALQPAPRRRQPPPGSAPGAAPSPPPAQQGCADAGGSNLIWVTAHAVHARRATWLQNHGRRTGAASLL